MSGRHAAGTPPSRDGWAVAVLGILGALPPAVILGPHTAGAHAARLSATSQATLAPHTTEPHTCRCGPRTAL